MTAPAANKAAGLLSRDLTVSRLTSFVITGAATTGTTTGGAITVSCELCVEDCGVGVGDLIEGCGVGDLVFVGDGDFSGSTAISGVGDFTG